MSVATPDDILNFWIGPTARDAGQLDKGHALWFGKSDDVDREIRTRFSGAITARAGGLAQEWAARGPRNRLAAVIALDQFPRNVFRGTPQAFAYDRIALGLTKEGLLTHADEELAEVEQVFFYLPLEHSERVADQALCVQLMEKLVKTARPEFKSFAEGTLDYAYRHKEVIDQFGRFPHRNSILGRENTSEEVAYLSQPGAGF